MKLIFSRSLYSRKTPLRPWLGPLQLRVPPLPRGIKLVLADGYGPFKDVNCLFSLNIDSKRFQYLLVRIENRPQVSERGVDSPLSSLPLAAPLPPRARRFTLCVCTPVNISDSLHYFLRRMGINMPHRLLTFKNNRAADELGTHKIWLARPNVWPICWGRNTGLSIQSPVLSQTVIKWI